MCTNRVGDDVVFVLIGYDVIGLVTRWFVYK